jgi:hypothetical protein
MAADPKAIAQAFLAAYYGAFAGERTRAHARDGHRGGRAGASRVTAEGARRHPASARRPARQQQACTTSWPHSRAAQRVRRAAGRAGNLAAGRAFRTSTLQPLTPPPAAPAPSAAGNAAQLGGLYGPDSVLSLDGQCADGAAQIGGMVLTPRVRAEGCARGHRVGGGGAVAEPSARTSPACRLPPSARSSPLGPSRCASARRTRRWWAPRGSSSCSSRARPTSGR